MAGRTRGSRVRRWSVARLKLRGYRLSRGVVAGLVALIFLLPLYIAFVTSLDDPSHVFTYPPHLSVDFNGSAYVQAWHLAAWPMYFANTAIITVATVLLVLVTSLLAAYALSFSGLKRREAVFRVFVVGLIVPGEALLVPNFLILDKMGLINTRLAQILPFAASVYGIFLLRQFFMTLPRSYWEAAVMDGAGPLRFLWSVAVPMAKPILITVGLYIFIGSWNSFQWPLIVTSSHRVQPIEVAVEQFAQNFPVAWRRLSAVGLMATGPLILLFLLVQKHIVAGIGRSGGIR